MWGGRRYRAPLGHPTACSVFRYPRLATYTEGMLDADELMITRVTADEIRINHTIVPNGNYERWLDLIIKDNYRYVAETNREGYSYIPAFGTGFHLPTIYWLDFMRGACEGTYSIERLPFEATEKPSPDNVPQDAVATDSSPDSTFHGHITGEGVITRFHI